MKVNPEHETTSAVVFNELQHEVQVLATRIKRLRIILGVIIVLSIISIATTAIVLRLNWGEELYQDTNDSTDKKDDDYTGEEDEDQTNYNNDDQTDYNNDDNTVEDTPFCQKFAEKCAGVNATVMNYLKGKGYNYDEMNSMLQLAQNYEQIGTGDSKQVFKEIDKSIKCASAIFGPAYSEPVEQMQNLYLSNPQKLDSYITMVEQFNGEKIIVSTRDGQYLYCKFLLLYGYYQKQSDERTFYPPQPSSSPRSFCLKWYDPVLHFINGIGFTPQGAQRILYAIDKARKQKALGVRYLACSAPSRKQKGIIQDLIDAWELKFQEQHQTSVDQRILKRIALYFHGDPLDEESEEFLSNSQYRDTILDEYNQFIYSRISDPDTNYNVQSDVDDITWGLQYQSQVILVAHSHGTIYANTIHAKLDQKYHKSVAMLFLGAAASQIADGYNLYITNEADLVIGSFRQMIDSSIEPLAGNVESTEYGPFFHSSTGYIENFNELFKSKLQTAYNLPIQPGNQFDSGYGAINVLLIQEKNIADLNLDLHVYEPEQSGIAGYHLYYGNTQGRIGALYTYSEYEYYQVACYDDMKEGTYEFKMNYFAGTGVSSYRIKVKAGFQLKTIDGQTDSASIGESGNQNPPISLFKIKVTLNEIWNYFEYEIIEG